MKTIGELLVFCDSKLIQADFFQPSIRAGRKSNVLMNVKTAANVIPTRRKGKARSQTIGKRTSASRATGQHSTNKMHQPTKRIRVFIC